MVGKVCGKWGECHKNLHKDMGKSIRELFRCGKPGRERTDKMSATRTNWWKGWAGVLAVAGVFALQAVAETETVDGVEWTFSVADGQTTVGSGNWNGPAVSRSLSGALAVPPVLGGYPVTAIAAYAFQDCSNLTEVTIPVAVTNIGLDAFWECSSLTNVSIPSGVTEIGRMAFYGCEALPAVAIPDGVVKIDLSTFAACSALREVSIPSGATFIGREAFSFCSNLVALALPASMEPVGEGAFYRCNGLAALYVPAEWENPEEMLSEAELPPECPIIRYDATGETRTADSPVPVPHAWLALKASAALAANGSDFEAAAMATAANGRGMWECYVAGLDPVAKDRNFTAEISIVDGKPEVESVDPDLGDARSYTLRGKKGMMGEGWDDMATVPGSEEGEYRFFCVGVSLAE